MSLPCDGAESSPAPSAEQASGAELARERGADVDPRELEDPIGDDAYRVAPRLTHRYRDRVLLFPTYRCASRCPHCFRHLEVTTSEDSTDAEAEPGVLEPAFRYLEAHPEVHEVILTGGDPLMLQDPTLERIRRRLEQLPHLRLLRVHTRMLVSRPSRFTSSLVASLRGALGVCVVTHVNHPRELTDAALEAARLMREAGFMLLNQSVLLRGINNDLLTLETLFRDLVYRAGIKPYYLHHCDLAQGLKRYRTSLRDGMALMDALRARVSGICLPTYVLDLPGGRGKIPLSGATIAQNEGFHWVFRDRNGDLCSYHEVIDENPL